MVRGAGGGGGAGIIGFAVVVDDDDDDDNGGRRLVAWYGIGFEDFVVEDSEELLRIGVDGDSEGSRGSEVDAMFNEQRRKRRDIYFEIILSYLI